MFNPLHTCLFWASTEYTIFRVLKTNRNGPEAEQHHVQYKQCELEPKKRQTFAYSTFLKESSSQIEMLKNKDAEMKKNRRDFLFTIVILYQTTYHRKKF